MLRGRVAESRQSTSHAPQSPDVTVAAPDPAPRRAASPIAGIRGVFNYLVMPWLVYHVWRSVAGHAPFS